MHAVKFEKLLNRLLQLRRALDDEHRKNLVALGRGKETK